MAVEFQSGANRFSLPGEALFAVFNNRDLIGVGGVSQCPYSPELNGRIRRMYIAKKYRGVGAGKLLLKRIEEYASTYFEQVVLFTDSREAAKFYERCRYLPVNLNKVSHAKSLGECFLGGNSDLKRL
ncbi:GNAT family N-acetyltransferase [Gilvimarinus chinensis]|uniref:GNAT family N-acetyltransferase n=1 Tax=Gilvimarinus chinensis TaxID=396005 RepID=UPI003CCC3756